jgi:roadblock/LC7 domain-containing protein
MAHTQADLDAIKTAIASGEQSVEVGGRKVVYRSVEELRKARDDITAELAAADNVTTSAVRRGSYSVRFATARE